MAKKIFLSIVLAAICILGISTISFAKSENTTTDLGDKVTSSINKTERSMDDLADRTELDKAGRTIENGARAVGNAVSDGMDNIGRGVEDLTTDGETRDDKTRTENRAVAGRTGNYTAGQIGQTNPDTTNGGNGMTQNAWIWIVMVVVALIIVASVWFYAAQHD